MFRCWTLTLVFSCLATATATGQTAHTEVEHLLKQLGHNELSKREEASKGLEAIGAPALTALRQAAKQSPEAEVRRRAEALIEIMESQVTEAFFGLVFIAQHAFSPLLDVEDFTMSARGIFAACSIRKGMSDEKVDEIIGEGIPRKFTSANEGATGFSYSDSVYYFGFFSVNVFIIKGKVVTVKTSLYES